MLSIGLLGLDCPNVFAGLEIKEVKMDLKEAIAAGALTPAEMRSAIVTDAFSIPIPEELFTALEKHAKPQWLSEYRKDPPTSFNDRTQLALNLGMLIADGYIAIQAEDAKRVKDVGKEVIKLSNALGVSQEIMERGKALTRFADQKDWATLKQELDATQNEVKMAMINQRDSELVTLVSLGGWIRGTQIVTNVIKQHFSPQASILLRQPDIVTHLQSKLEAINAKEKPLLGQIDAQLKKIQELVSFPVEMAPDKAEVEKLNQLASELVLAISTKLANTAPQTISQRLVAKAAASKIADSDAATAARAKALDYADALENEGYKVRDGYWSGTWQNRKDLKVAKANLYVGNEYYFVLASDGKAKRVALHLYDEKGNPVNNEQLNQELHRPIAAAGFSPESSGQYFVTAELLEGEPGEFCVVYAYR